MLLLLRFLAGLFSLLLLLPVPLREGWRKDVHVVFAQRPSEVFVDDRVAHAASRGRGRGPVVAGGRRRHDHRGPFFGRHRGRRSGSAAVAGRGDGHVERLLRVPETDILPLVSGRVSGIVGTRGARGESAASPGRFYRVRGLGMDSGPAVHGLFVSEHLHLRVLKIFHVSIYRLPPDIFFAHQRRLRYSTSVLFRTTRVHNFFF